MRNQNKHAMHGGAMVEMALFLPILLIILFGVIDFSRAIQFDNILIHMSREGANLAARRFGALPQAPAGTTPEALKMQQITTALSATAQPLAMTQHGMIYITEIRGQASGQGLIVGQYRSVGQNALPSRIWTCGGGWRTDNSCNIGAGTLLTLPFAMRTDETIFAVETQYDYQMLSRYLFNQGPDLYAVTIL